MLRKYYHSKALADFASCLFTVLRDEKYAV
jgi:hypothetical protein